jgi:hypothetical protein
MVAEAQQFHDLVESPILGPRTTSTTDSKTEIRGPAAGPGSMQKFCALEFYEQKGNGGGDGRLSD